MSVTAISSNSGLSQNLQDWQVRAQKIQSEFQQLGQDLQAGDLSQAQSDFSVLSQNVSGSLQNNSSIAQEFSALGAALQSGNLSAAQKAYVTMQQDVQQSMLSEHTHHHHGGSGGLSSGSSTTNPLSSLFGSLGSALQSGNLSAAQTAYSTLQQGFQQLTSSMGSAAKLTVGAVSLLA